jgi:hypothetical protein
MLSYILSARLYSWVESKIKRKSFVIEVPLEQDNIHDYYDLVDSTIQLMEREIKIKNYGK